ncbi:FkbM family methyltransferase [Microcoleus sp.]|uniref:FkbM family methyltransferase n=1 Tax=Microcoleus sp. TaxID=44472 RepID=UPI0035253498
MQTSELVQIKKSIHEESWKPAYKFLPELIQKFNLKVGAEIGVAFGGHSEAMLSNTNLELLYGIDSYKHSDSYDDPMNLPQADFDILCETTKNRLAVFGDRFKLIRSNSQQAVRQIDGLLDFVYIDAEHSYQGVWQDLCTWYSKIRVGGLISGHDYEHIAFPGVKQAIDEFFRRLNWQVHLEGEGVWWVEKQAVNISFFIPAYNCEETIEESVDSILNGNFEQGDELIIVNDCSTDNTEGLLERLKIKYPFIKIFRHETNKGGGAARNTAVQNSSHPLLFCLDSDNILVPGSIEKLKDFLVDSGADVTAFQEIIFFEGCKENIINKWIYPDKITLADFFSRHDFPGSSGNYLFTKESWVRAGGYSESSGALDTHTFGFRQLATGSKMLTLPNTYYCHRQGIESYFVRFSRTNNLSLTLADIITPFAHLIADADWQYMCGEGKDNWYENINQRPICLSNEVKSMQTERELQLVEVLPEHKEEKKQSRNSVISDGEIQAIARLVNNAGNVVFDVGANAGDWTTEVLSQGHDVEIHLFEPIPHVYKKLIQNLDKQVIANNLAVGQKEEVKTFYYYEANPLLSTFYRRVDVEKQGWLTPPKAITVLTTTIDNYCQRHGIKRINFIKIDAGGSELDVIYGAKYFLETGRIDYLQFEYGGTYLDAKTSLKEAFEYLQKFRYSIFKILPDRLEYKPSFLPEDENFEFSNFLAVNERFRSNVLGEVTDGKLNIQELCRQYAIAPRGVIHVGAHEGTEITAYQQMGAQKVLFVEANPSVFERLQANIADYPNVEAVNCAIADRNGTIDLHVTSFDQSSSILQLKRHQEIYPHITETHQITVESKTLDTLLQEQEVNPSDFNILNIDIQGAELLALQGATNWLKCVDLINTEVNYEELYEGCALIDQLDEFLEGHGFQRAATTTPIHPSWGDAIYVKKTAITSSVLGMENMGRLGNQVFLYAFLRTYAREHNLRVETPAWIGQYLFGHNDHPISQPLPQVGEQAQPYKLSESAILNAPEPFTNVDFHGYFQFHTQYHAQHKEYFQSLFKPLPAVEAKVIKALDRLRSKGKTVVGLHLRRGDYRSVHTVVPYLTVAPSGWYKEWLDGFWETLDEPVLFIASDEIETVVGDFADYNPITVKDLGVELPEAPFYPDFYILSQCDVLAISNSTFSFAAAMLNEQCKFFFRPNLLKQKMIAFDPWNSEPLLRNNPNDLPATESQKPVKILNIQEVALISVEDPELLWGFSIDSPTFGTHVTPSNILIGGWVIGKKSPAVKVELIRDGEVISNIPVNQHRPDVAAVFPGVPLAENSGYAIEWEIMGTLPECEISIQAVLADDTRVSIGFVRLQEIIYSTPKDSLRAKCKLSVCAIMKDEAPYLIEWLEFHKIVGVERFYLYNNNSSDNTLDIVQPYIQSGEVVLHDWPFSYKQQGSAYEHCLASYKQESELIAFIDLDEFLFPTEKENLIEVLEEFDSCPAVVVNMLNFGSSGHEIRPEGLQIENFTKRAEDNFEENMYVKSIVRPEQIRRPNCTHFFIPINQESFSVTENKEPLGSSISEKLSVQKLRINHYFTRSKQEAKQKVMRGDAFFPWQKALWVMEHRDRNEVEDLTIQRFVPRLRQAVDAVISKSRIAQIVTEQWRSQSKLYEMQIQLEEFQTELARTQKNLAFSESQLHQTEQQLKQSNYRVQQFDVDLQRISKVKESNPLQRKILAVVDVTPAYPEALEWLRGFNLDSPTVGKVDNNEILISGWVLGKIDRAVAVEFIYNDETVLTIPVNGYRSDVVSAYPELPLAANSTYEARLKIAVKQPEFEVLLQAVLANETRVKLGVVRLQEVEYKFPLGNQKQKYRMKWFFAINEASPGFEIYSQMIKVAVYTAQQNTSLEPYCIYDGEENELTDWLQKNGVKIIYHRIPHYEKLQTQYPCYSTVAFGAFLRIEIPKIVEIYEMQDEYVLYTDCDVMFFHDVVDYLQGVTCEYLAATPEHDPNNWEYFNSGVLYMNVKNLQKTQKEFDDFIDKNLDQILQLAYDQGAYNLFFKDKWDRLDIQLNWKSYWNFTPEAKIIHFHGPKPTQAEEIKNQIAPASSMLLANGFYWLNTGIWQFIYEKIEELDAGILLKIAECEEVAPHLEEPREELAQSQTKLEQNPGGFEQFTTKLQKVQEELQPIKEELEIRQVQYQKTQEELAQTKSELIEVQAQLQEMESAAAPLNQLAELYLAQGQLEEAIAVCEQSLKIQPKFAPAYKTLGNVFQAQGKLDEGKSYYLRALEIQPDFAQALANLGTIHAQQQQWQEAIAAYQKAIAIQPNFPGVYRNLAKVFSQVGKPDEVVECCYAAAILEPKTTAEEYFNLGNTLLEQGKQERAIVCYRRAVELNPDEVEVYYKLGETLAKVGQLEEAISAYRRAIELTSSN